MPLKKLAVLCFYIFLGQAAIGQSAKTDSISRARFIKTRELYADSLNAEALKLARDDDDKEQLNVALSYIMKGLHVYSSFNDSLGLRQSFDNLASIYQLQQKNVQAKWFLLQSNTMARAMKDTTSIINSLLKLASLKIDLNDFTLAKTDLTDAEVLAKRYFKSDGQISTEQLVAALYSKAGDQKDASMALKRIKDIRNTSNKAPKQPDRVAAKPNLPDTNSKQVTKVSQPSGRSKPHSISQLAIGFAVVVALLIVAFLIVRAKARRK